MIHDDTPSGGRKIIYSYANYLAEKGNDVKITFIADAPYHQRRYNRLAEIKHMMNYVHMKSKQKQVTWYPLSNKIVLKTVPVLKDAIKNNNGSEKIIFTDFSFPLSYQEHIGKLTSNMFYLIQHDEAVYARESIVRDAWKLNIKKIVIASWLKNEIEKYSDQVYLVKNYTEVEKFYLTTPFSKRNKVVSMIYHTLPAKGTPDGLRAMKIIKEKIPDAVMILFGTPDRPKELPDDYIYYKCADSDLLRESVYNQSRVFIMPSLKEGWGLVATEAMACGAALVSTYNGGVDDFAINEKTALLSPPGDYSSIANNVILLLESPVINEVIADSGHSEVNKLLFQNSAMRFEEVIRN
ncbi:glycosyltransferase family 4 protein [Latilactobacillus sakei]|uniref:glycosyltransferase family 4 protein n=1 Tax=Latilactobacillus sakei TaxID=1599 RepID=UPI003F53D377